ncbi:ATP-binding cassette domain-containing protein [uncultured Cellulomonas sp.]|uniref:ATP-binding cassette domain-containing protein n=1 Tax=uncultured Cellulomonas sp. TaxID=189682 RepID=UPI002610A3A5|nr:ATP-binding cassette domain-containing protein [uncultured Cellulomonas sp.]
MIHARGLVQTFDTRQGRVRTQVRAVDGVDLDVAEGEVVGFLGPNGAGKTTTLRMLTTLLRPTAGSATVAGHDVVAEPVQVRRAIGYVSQAGGAFSGARAGDEVVDHGMLYGLPRDVVEQRGKALFERMDLPGLWARMPRSMSGGQKRRLDIVMGLIHEPQLVFLDEPTTGLDPQARANLWEHIRDLRDRLGVTVFLTTHYLDEADALSDRIVIIDHGRIVASDTADALKAQVAGDLVDLELVDRDRLADAAQRLATLVDGRSEVEVVDHHVRARVPRAGRSVPGLIRDLDRVGIGLESIEVRRPTLDDVFLSLTGRSLRDADAAGPQEGGPTTALDEAAVPVTPGTATGTPTAGPPPGPTATGSTTPGPTTTQGALR